MYRGTQSNWGPDGRLRWTRRVLVLAMMPVDGTQHAYTPPMLPISRKRWAKDLAEKGVQIPPNGV